ncbi:hypothetical protein I8751_28150 [Nostocaceae cyanobacterium CENA357]|uniref:ApeI dehydratase-like domain-containing protein n=1 Tax=Atlanticothrix silvestris CENA357 TaxID=1725252 RepID=A0A8J7HJC1_9CYAN|nr:hypothetical protein [Atlanticothrix silvestris]MBH8556141.1 hypothetical protein [Atlanticothrix silvestris CENA357]
MNLFPLERITTIDPGKKAQAWQNVPHTLSFFSTHFPRFPVVPGVLLLGNFAELAAWLLNEQTGQQWKLAGAERVRFMHFVKPGDQMEVAVELKKLSVESALLSGTIQVAGKVVVTARQIRLFPIGKGVDS